MLRFPEGGDREEVFHRKFNNEVLVFNIACLLMIFLNVITKSNNWKNSLEK